jgi:hypothetical protein
MTTFFPEDSGLPAAQAQNYECPCVLASLSIPPHWSVKSAQPLAAESKRFVLTKDDFPPGKFDPIG